jgi:hypothetical protein
MTIFRYSLIALGLSLSLTTPVTAQEGVRADRILSASELHSRCASTEASQVGRLGVAYCLGAITGIADATMTLNALYLNKQTICFEPKDDSESLRLAVLLFMENRPATFELPAATVVVTALQRQYPCTEEK